MAPEITVLMPVHNVEAYVRESAASILAQTFTDLELLVVDDASTDGTVGVLDRLGDPRVRVIKSRDRLRFSGALNLGLELATGRFLARMDGDDIAVPDRLEIQHRYLMAHPDVGMCGGMAEMFGIRRGVFFRQPLSHGAIQSYMLFDNPFVHPSVMLRREVIERHHLRYDAAYCPTDDYELWSRAVRLFPAVNLDRTVLRYRVHAASLTQSEWADMDGHAARVAARELAALGLAVDADALRFHRNVGRGRCFALRHRGELTRAEAWLKTLIGANLAVGRYPDREFRRVVAGVWYSACYHAGSLGPWAMIRYAQSELRRPASANAREWAALLSVTARRISA